MTRLNRQLYRGIAALGGAAITLSLAPLSIWPLALIGPALIFWALNHCERADGGKVAWWAGFSLCLSGASWVYVSIHFHSDTPALVAALMTLLFCGFLALFYALIGWIYTRYFRHTSINILTFAALWVLDEALRGVLFTGFPWLFLGHALTDSPAAFLLSLIGTSGASFIMALSAALLSVIVSSKSHRRFTASLFSVTICIAIYASQWIPVNTYRLGNSPLSVGIAQGNIPQEDKWKPENVRTTISTYLRLSEPLWGSDIVVWPESAITIDYWHAQSFLTTLDDISTEHQTSLITGIPFVSKDYQRIHNSITAVGLGDGLYHKQKLVPFGEYVPLQHIIRGTLAFFDLPMSSFTRGPSEQKNLTVGDYQIAPYICYEIAYSEFVRENLGSANFLVTISNDAWFGGSWAPWQHQQIAQTRALETGRYVIRATNDGISSIIAPTGQIIVASPQFTETTISGDIWPIEGKTPFIKLGNYPIYCLAFIIIVLGIFSARKIARD